VEIIGVGASRDDFRDVERGGRKLDTLRRGVGTAGEDGMGRREAREAADDVDFVLARGEAVTGMRESEELLGRRGLAKLGGPACDLDEISETVDERDTLRRL
jgi:hypothetical protein